MRLNSQALHDTFARRRLVPQLGSPLHLESAPQFDAASQLLPASQLASLSQCDSPSQLDAPLQPSSPSQLDAPPHLGPALQPVLPSPQLDVPALLGTRAQLSSTALLGTSAQLFALAAQPGTPALPKPLAELNRPTLLAWHSLWMPIFVSYILSLRHSMSCHAPFSSKRDSLVMTCHDIVMSKVILYDSKDFL